MILLSDVLTRSRQDRRGGGMWWFHYSTDYKKCPLNPWSVMIQFDPPTLLKPLKKIIPGGKMRYDLVASELLFSLTSL